MANNRMWLVNDSGTRVLLAKYYPSMGWCLWDAGELNATFHASNFGYLTPKQSAEGVLEPEPHISMYGDTSWRIEYETD